MTYGRYDEENNVVMTTSSCYDLIPVTVKNIENPLKLVRFARPRRDSVSPRARATARMITDKSPQRDIGKHVSPRPSLQRQCVPSSILDGVVTVRQLQPAGLSSMQLGSSIHRVTSPTRDMKSFINSLRNYPPSRSSSKSPERPAQGSRSLPENECAKRSSLKLEGSPISLESCSRKTLSNIKKEIFKANCLNHIIKDEDFAENTKSFKKNLRPRKCKTPPLTGSGSKYKNYQTVYMQSVHKESLELSKTVAAWLKNIPISLDNTLSMKVYREKRINEIKTKLRLLKMSLNVSEFELKGLIEVQKCLRDLNVWVPDDVNKDIFIEKLSKKLIDDIKKTIPPQTEDNKFEDDICSIVDDIQLPEYDSQGNRVDKHKLVKHLVYNLRKLTSDEIRALNEVINGTEKRPKENDTGEESAVSNGGRKDVEKLIFRRISGLDIAARSSQSETPRRMKCILEAPPEDDIENTESDSSSATQAPDNTELKKSYAEKIEEWLRDSNLSNALKDSEIHIYSVLLANNLLKINADASKAPQVVIDKTMDWIKSLSQRNNLSLKSREVDTTAASLLTYINSVEESDNEQTAKKDSIEKVVKNTLRNRKVDRQKARIIVSLVKDAYKNNNGKHSERSERERKLIIDALKENSDIPTLEAQNLADTMLSRDYIDKTIQSSLRKAKKNARSISPKCESESCSLQEIYDEEERRAHKLSKYQKFKAAIRGDSKPNLEFRIHESGSYESNIMISKSTEALNDDNATTVAVVSNTDKKSMNERKPKIEKQQSNEMKSKVDVTPSNAKDSSDQADPDNIECLALELACMIKEIVNKEDMTPEEKKCTIRGEVEKYIEKIPIKSRGHSLDRAESLLDRLGLTTTKNCLPSCTGINQASNRTNIGPRILESRSTDSRKPSLVRYENRKQTNDRRDQEKTDGKQRTVIEERRTRDIAVDESEYIPNESESTDASIVRNARYYKNASNVSNARNSSSTKAPVAEKYEPPVDESEYIPNKSESTNASSVRNARYSKSASNVSNARNASSTKAPLSEKYEPPVDESECIPNESESTNASNVRNARYSRNASNVSNARNVSSTIAPDLEEYEPPVLSGNKDIMDELHEEIENWANDAANENNGLEAKDTINNLQNKLVLKIGALILNPEIVNDKFSYEQSINDEVDKALRPLLPDIILDKRSLIERLKRLRKRAKTQAGVRTFKVQLREAITNNTPKSRHAKVEPNQKNILEILKDNIVDDFIVHTHSPDNLKHSKQVDHDIYAYLTEYSHDVDKLTFSNALRYMRAIKHDMNKIVKPNSEIISALVNEIKLKAKINAILEDHLDIGSTSEYRKTSKQLTLMAKSLRDVCKITNPDERADVAKHEIRKWLDELPLDADDPFEDKDFLVNKILRLMKYCGTEDECPTSFMCSPECSRSLPVAERFVRRHSCHPYPVDVDYSRFPYKTRTYKKSICNQICSRQATSGCQFPGKNQIIIHEYINKATDPEYVYSTTTIRKDKSKHSIRPTRTQSAICCQVNISGQNRQSQSQLDDEATQSIQAELVSSIKNEEEKTGSKEEKRVSKEEERGSKEKNRGLKEEQRGSKEENTGTKEENRGSKEEKTAIKDAGSKDKVLLINSYSQVEEEDIVGDTGKVANVGSFIQEICPAFKPSRIRSKTSRGCIKKIDALELCNYHPESTEYKPDNRPEFSQETVPDWPRMELTDNCPYSRDFNRTDLCNDRKRPIIELDFDYSTEYNRTRRPDAEFQRENLEQNKLRQEYCPRRRQFKQNTNPYSPERRNYKYCPYPDYNNSDYEDEDISPNYGLNRRYLNSNTHNVHEQNACHVIRRDIDYRRAYKESCNNNCKRRKVTPEKLQDSGDDYYMVCEYCHKRKCPFPSKIFFA